MTSTPGHLIGGLKNTISAIYLTPPLLFFYFIKEMALSISPIHLIISLTRYAEIYLKPFPY